MRPSFPLFSPTTSSSLATMSPAVHSACPAYLPSVEWFSVAGLVHRHFAEPRATCSSSCPRGPGQSPGPCYFFSAYHSHSFPSAQVCLRPQSPWQWMLRAAVTISIAISIGALHLPSTASLVYRTLLSLTLTSVITSVRRTSSRVVLVVASLLADMSGQSCFLPRLRVNPLCCVDSSSHCPDSAVKLAQGSIRCLESIAAVRFSIAIVVADLTR